MAQQMFGRRVKRGSETRKWEVFSHDYNTEKRDVTNTFEVPDDAQFMGTQPGPNGVVRILFIRSNLTASEQEIADEQERREQEAVEFVQNVAAFSNKDVDDITSEDVAAYQEALDSDTTLDDIISGKGKSDE